MNVVQNSPVIAAGLALLLMVSTSRVDAQSGGAFDIARSTVDAGGGQSSGGDFELVGTIAQADADAAIASGGGFTLRGGFHAAASPPLGDDVFKDGFENP